MRNAASATYAEAVAGFTIAGTPAQIVKDVDPDWKALYNGFADKIRDAWRDEVQTESQERRDEDVADHDPSRGSRSCTEEYEWPEEVELLLDGQRPGQRDRPLRRQGRCVPTTL